MKMVILSLLSSGNGSLCPTTALREERETDRWSQKMENASNVRGNWYIVILGQMLCANAKACFVLITDVLDWCTQYIGNGYTYDLFIGPLEQLLVQLNYEIMTMFLSVRLSVTVQTLTDGCGSF